MNKSSLAQIVHDLIYEYFGPPLSVGKICKHPDGRTVKIKSGMFLDPTYGRLSNWWTWNEVLADGSLGPDEKGYGWSVDKSKDAKANETEK